MPGAGALEGVRQPIQAAEVEAVAVEHLPHQAQHHQLAQLAVPLLPLAQRGQIMLIVLVGAAAHLRQAEAVSLVVVAAQAADRLLEAVLMADHRIFRLRLAAAAVA